jgi:hypothetical protein
MLTLIDQGLFTGANFVLALLLTLDSGVTETGDYALVSSVAVLLHSLFSGAVTEPMTIYGAASAAARLRLSYAKVASVFTGTLLMAGAAGYVCALVLNIRLLVNLSLGFALFACQAVVLCHKRYLYLVGRPREAVKVSARYAAVSVTAAAFASACYRFGVQELAAVLLIGSVVSSLGWASRVFTATIPIGVAASRAWEQRRFAIWLILSGIPSTIATQAIYWIADMRSSKEVVGRLKVFEQLAAPGQQVVSAVTIADQVECAAEAERGATQLFTAKTRRNALQYACVAALFIPLALLLAWVLGTRRPDIGVVAGLALLVYLLGLVAQSWSAAWNVAARVIRAPEVVAAGYFVMAIVVIATAMLIPSPTLTGFAAIVALGWVGQALTIWIGVRFRLAIPRSA